MTGTAPYLTNPVKESASKKYAEYIIIAPPQHDTLRCFLYVDSFQGGSFNLSENISDLISFTFYRLNSPQGRRLSCLLWLQWLQCVDRC